MSWIGKNAPVKVMENVAVIIRLSVDFATGTDLLSFSANVLLQPVPNFEGV